MSAHLFDPIDLRDVHVPNRITVSPMGMHSAIEGVAGDWHLMHLGQFAISGAGLVITEAVAVTPEGRVSPFDLGLWNNEQAAGLKRITSFAATYGGARFGIQLYHAGRKASVQPSFLGHKSIAVGEGGWAPEAPSRLAYPGRNEPVALDEAAMLRVRDAFVTAAKRADSAGFDLIELHAAHGYLLHNYLSPLSNVRNDDYGGSLANRMRYPLEVFDAIRPVWPSGKALGVRISATDWAKGGWDLEQTLAFARALKERGCDYMCVSSGGCVPEQTITVGPLYQVPFAAAVREQVGMPTMAVGLIRTTDEAAQIVRDGHADMCALARGMLSNPRWAWDAAEKLGAKAFYPRQYDRATPAMRDNDSFTVRTAERAKRR
jgi:2,4-dienoyl-CoA reductase-like NADH-dependent reductase (Old Yellow Enzyme family)